METRDAAHLIEHNEFGVAHVVHILLCEEAHEQVHLQEPSLLAAVQELVLLDTETRSEAPYVMPAQQDHHNLVGSPAPQHVSLLVCMQMIEPFCPSQYQGTFPR